MKAKSVRLALFIALFLAPRSIAQIGGTGADGIFQPTSDITLDTTPRPGGWNFSSITIPAGVTVRVVGTNPAILRSQGAVLVAGHLNADGFPPDATTGTGGAGGPGGFAGGNVGASGAGPAGGPGGSYSPFGISSGTPGGHATPGYVYLGSPTGTYGSDWVFDMRGGSGQGGGTWPLSYGYPWGSGGAGGGGVLVVLSDATIDVTGLVTSRGSHTTNISGLGAGGSIMLRAINALTVGSIGLIDAAGGRHPLGITYSGDGFIRLDGYGDAPAVAPSATITPTPLTLSLPALRETLPPQTGTTYTLEVATVPGDTVAFFASTASANLPLPPLGTLGIDPALALLLGTSIATNAEPDPQATLSLALPNDPALVGLSLWLQSINAATSSPGGPRLSNVVTTQIL